MPKNGVDPKGSEIERLRLGRGWPRPELARRVGISRKTVYGIEKGFNRSSQETLQRIATELGVALGAVMEDKPADPPPKRTAYPTSHPKPTAPAPPPRPTKRAVEDAA